MAIIDHAAQAMAMNPLMCQAARDCSRLQEIRITMQSMQKFLDCPGWDKCTGDVALTVLRKIASILEEP